MNDMFEKILTYIQSVLLTTHFYLHANRRGPPVHGRRDGCVPGLRRCPGIRNPLSSRPSSGRRSKGCIHIPVWKGSGHGIMPGIVENPSAAVCRCFTAMHKGPDGHSPGRCRPEECQKIPFSTPSFPPSDVPANPWRNKFIRLIYGTLCGMGC